MTLDEESVMRGLRLYLMMQLKSRASDIHLDPTQDGLRVRFRIDGVLIDQHHFLIRLSTVYYCAFKDFSQY